MEGETFATLVEVLSLDGAGQVDGLVCCTLGVDGQRVAGNLRLASFSIGGYSRKLDAALCRRYIGIGKGLCCQGFCEHLVDVHLHVLDGTGSRRGVDGYAGGCAHGSRRGVGLDRDAHRVVHINATQDDLVEVESVGSTLHAEAQYLLTFGQLLGKASMLHLIRAPCTSLDGADGTCEVGQSVVVAQRPRVCSTAVLRRNVHVILVESGFLDVNGILQPFAVGDIADGIAAADALDIHAGAIRSV